MSVTQTLKGLGSWDVRLRADTPRHVTDAIVYFGHIAVSAGRPDVRVARDSLLDSARYVGVVRRFEGNGDSGYVLGGVGMAMWLGDEDNKGSVIETPITFTASTFTNAVRSLLPQSGAVTEGTLHSVAGTYSQTHVYQSPRKAIDYVCDTMGAEWRVNHNGTLDAGTVTDLYGTTPTVAVIRRGAGTDMTLRALPGVMRAGEDVEDFTTRVVLLAEGSELTVATGSADINPALNNYKDLHGNTIAMTRLVSESATAQGNAPARAQLALNHFTRPRNSISLSTDRYDVVGDGLSTGGWAWVHDPDTGMVDPANELVFRGQRLNPVKLRVIELSWPVDPGMSVAYRDVNGAWTDLTDYVIPESGSTTIVVGGYNRSLTGAGPAGSETVGSRPQPNTTIPAAPVFTLPLTRAVYQSPTSGITRAQVLVAWSAPLNTDGTAIIDGDHYEIQYRTSAAPLFPATHSQMSGFTHAQLAAGTHDQPITFTPGPWQSAVCGWDSTSMLLQELTPGMPYDLRIRAYDNGSPANVSEWGSTTSIQTNTDSIAPSAPAEPEVAASRLAIQVVHRLGRSSGGTYNLELDLHHLEVHAEYEPTFFPDSATLLGKLVAGAGMITGQIPVVGTFPVESTEELYVKVVAVDEAGNKSVPSGPASATAELIDDAHISDLTVSKVTAGTISADWLLAGSIKTGVSGARMEADAAGLRLYNSGGTNTVNLDAAAGNATVTGTIQTGVTGNRIIMDPTYSQPGAGTFPSLVFSDPGQPGPGRINCTGPAMGVNSPPSASGSSFNQTTLLLMSGSATLQYNNESNSVTGGRVFVDDQGSGVEHRIAGDRAGGFAWATADSGWIGYYNQFTAYDSYYRVYQDDTHYLAGKYNNNDTWAVPGNSAVATGSTFITAGFLGVTILYGATMISTMAPVVGIQSNPPTFTWCITWSSSTSFGVEWTDTNSKIVNWWSPRM